MSSNKDIDLRFLDLDEEDAVFFTSLCQFVWIQGEPLPLIYDLEDTVYLKHGINFTLLTHLDAIGLIFLEPAGYVKRWFGKHTHLFYFDNITKIQFPHGANNQLDLGHVLLTDKGKALAAASNATRNQEFYEYVIEKWFREGLVTSSVLKRH